MTGICAELPLTCEAVLRIDGAKGDFDATRNSSSYGLSEAAYAATAIISSNDSFWTTGFMRPLHSPARAPSWKS
jgi:hypothetical protein